MREGRAEKPTAHRQVTAVGVGSLLSCVQKDLGLGSQMASWQERTPMGSHAPLAEVGPTPLHMSSHRACSHQQPVLGTAQAGGRKGKRPVLT